MQSQIRDAFWLIGIVAAVFLLWYLWLSKGTPPGQPPLTSLTQNNLDQPLDPGDLLVGDSHLAR